MKNATDRISPANSSKIRSSAYWRPILPAGLNPAGRIEIFVLHSLSLSLASTPKTRVFLHTYRQIPSAGTPYLSLLVPRPNSARNRVDKRTPSVLPEAPAILPHPARTAVCIVPGVAVLQRTVGRTFSRRRLSRRISCGDLPPSLTSRWGRPRGLSYSSQSEAYSCTVH